MPHNRIAEGGGEADRKRKRQSSSRSQGDGRPPAAKRARRDLGRSRSSRAASIQTAVRETLGSDHRDQEPATQTLSQELHGYLAPLSSVFAVSVSTGKANRKRKRQSSSQRSQGDGRPPPAKRARRGRSRSSRAVCTQTAGQERLGSGDRHQEPLPDPTQKLNQKLPRYLAPLSPVFSVPVSTGEGDGKRKKQSSSQRSQGDGHPSTATSSRREAYVTGPLLGRGGFGSVFAGIRRSDRLPVAIKYVSKDRTRKWLKVEGQGLLPLEVALMTRVNSAPTCPNVLQLVEWFDHPSHYSMILERPVPCQDLDSFCEENGCVDESLAKKVLVQLITALKHCESRGVLHRDVKPENLLICTASHDIKLLDFGCGDLLKDSAYTSFAGTFEYAPPEWFDQHCYHAGPATVWSVGVTLYNILCFPFRAAQRVFFRKGLSKECRQLISWCLSEAAEDRPSLDDILHHPWLR